MARTRWIVPCLIALGVGLVMVVATCPPSAMAQDQKDPNQGVRDDLQKIKDNNQTIDKINNTPNPTQEQKDARDRAQKQNARIEDGLKQHQAAAKQGFSALDAATIKLINNYFTLKDLKAKLAKETDEKKKKRLQDQIDALLKETPALEGTTLAMTSTTGGRMDFRDQKDEGPKSPGSLPGFAVWGSGLYRDFGNITMRSRTEEQCFAGFFPCTTDKDDGKGLKRDNVNRLQIVGAYVDLYYTLEQEFGDCGDLYYGVFGGLGGADVQNRQLSLTNRRDGTSEFGGSGLVHNWGAFAAMDDRPFRRGPLKGTSLYSGIYFQRTQADGISLDRNRTGSFDLFPGGTLLKSDVTARFSWTSVSGKIGLNTPVFGTVVTPYVGFSYNWMTLDLDEHYRGQFPGLIEDVHRKTSGRDQSAEALGGVKFPIWGPVSGELGFGGNSKNFSAQGVLNVSLGKLF